MEDTIELIVVTVADRRVALPLTAVDRVVRAVEITAVPECPAAVLGVINVCGEVLPVVSLRSRCGLPVRDLELGDQMVLARAARRGVALLVEDAEVVECPAGAVVPAHDVLGESGVVRGVLKREDGLVLVFDPDVLLSTADHAALDILLAAAMAPETT